MSVNTLGSSCRVLSTDPSLSHNWLMYLRFSYHYRDIVIMFQQMDFERALRIWESKLQMKIILWFVETFYVTNECYCYNGRWWRKEGSKVQVHHLLSTLSRSATIVNQIFQLCSHEHATLHPGWVSDFRLEYVVKISLSIYLSHTPH